MRSRRGRRVPAACARAAGRVVGVGMGGTAVSTVCTQVGLSWPSVHKAFIVHADETPNEIPDEVTGPVPGSGYLMPASLRVV